MDEESHFMDFSGSGDGDGPTILSGDDSWDGDPMDAPA